MALQKVIRTNLFVFTALLCLQNVFPQETSRKDPDVLYLKAVEAFKAENYSMAIALSGEGLKISPEYHDIRILRVKGYLSLRQFNEADRDINYLLSNAANYPDVIPLLLQRLDLLHSPSGQLKFLKEVEETIPENVTLETRRAELLIKTGNRQAGRKIAKKFISHQDITGSERYALQQILSRSTLNEIGVSYQYINFSEEYARNESWNNFTAEYLRNLHRTAVIARINYVDRGYEQGTLYELEAYPVFSDRFYAFTNIGASNGKVFPEIHSSLSLHYNFLKNTEAEIGGRIQNYESNSYFTAIAGLSLYQGNFYFNIRSFFGPERLNRVNQSYQANVRYYFKNADHYLFLKAGSGISPDDRFLATQELERPNLNAFFGQVGMNFPLGNYHIFQLSGGILGEEMSQGTTGTQYLMNVSYRYRF